MIIAGLDDSGRGPVVGPMILAGVSIDEEDLLKLKNFGIKDSKLLTKKKREYLFEEIIKLVKNHRIEIVYPPESDNALLSPDMNLNWLEAEKFAKIINELDADESIVDCPSPNIKAYSERLQSLLKVKTKLICEHHADKNFITCAAASILA